MVRLDLYAWMVDDFAVACYLLGISCVNGIICFGKTGCIAINL